MAEESRPGAAPRGRRLPAASRPPSQDGEARDAAPRSVGLGTLSVSLVARGEVPDRVRWRRFYEAVAAATGLVFALFALFNLWLWYPTPEPPPPVPLENVAVRLASVKLTPYRIRRRAAVVAPTGRAPGPVVIDLPAGHEVQSWRLECPGADEGAKHPVSRSDRAITIASVPARMCGVVVTSPGSNLTVDVTAGSHKRCVLKPMFHCM